MPHPRATRGRGRSAAPVVRADLRRSVGPAVHHPRTPAVPALPAAHPETSTGRADPAVHRLETSEARATTIGGHHGIRRTTTGVDGSTAPRGVMDCRRGAGARRRRPRGADRCHPLGDRRLRRSTTSASTSSRCGIPATTNGASGSSGSGFRSRSDRQFGETAASDIPGRPSIHLSEWRIGKCLSPPTNVVAMCSALPVRSTDSSRGSSSVKKLFTSILANAAPRQKCTP